MESARLNRGPPGGGQPDQPVGFLSSRGPEIIKFIGASQAVVQWERKTGGQDSSWSGDSLLGKKGRESPELREGKEVVGWAGGHFSRRLVFPSLAHHRTQPSYRLSPIYSYLFFSMNIFLSLLFIDLETGSIEISQLNMDLSIEKYIDLHRNIYLYIYKYGRTFEACPRYCSPTMSPGRKGPPFSFFPQSFRSFIHFIPLFGLRVGSFPPPIYAILCLRSWSC